MFIPDGVRFERDRRLHRRQGHELKDVIRDHVPKCTGLIVVTTTQLNAERFRRSANIEAVHIPFKGAPEALTEVVAGRLDFYFSPIAPALPLLREGKVLALAVGSSKRASVLPDLPTTIEAGFPDSDYNFWVGLFAPAKTPAALIERLYRGTSAALQSPEVRERLPKLGAEPMAMAPADFDALVRDELRTNAVLVKLAGIKPN